MIQTGASMSTTCAYRLILLSTLLLAALAGCSADAPAATPAGDELAVLLREGSQLLAQHDATAAALVFERAVALAPESADAHFLLGNAYSECLRHAEAETQYNETLALRPDDLNALSNLGVSYYNQGRFTEAEETLRAALAERPDDAEWHYNLGGVLLAMGRTDEALDEFTAANTLAPELPHPYLGLGSIYVSLGEADKAVAALERYLELTVADGDTEWRARAQDMLEQIKGQS